MNDLTGKSAVVAAGAKNLGGLISTTLANRGVNVAVHYNSDGSEAEADKTVAAVRAAGAHAIKVQGGLTVAANVAALFDAAVDAFGGVDYAVNTVGKVLRKPMLETTEAEYDSMFDINAKAAYFFLQQAGKRLNDNGSVVTIVTALLVPSPTAIPRTPVPRVRWSTSPAPRPKSSGAGESTSTVSRPGPWTHPSSTPRRPRSASSSTSRRPWATG